MMEIQVKWDDRGQVLVQVALGLVVLLLVVGLAIDGGNAYAQRRAMQNAADAGALAGARAICEGLDGDAARGWAEDYAERNGADLDLMESGDVVVDMGEGTVRVTVRKTAETFLMGLAGFETVDVAADAAAQCGVASAAAGLWPIAFDYPTYDTLGCGEAFLVWYDKNNDPPDNLCELCDCTDLEEAANIGAFGTKALAPGNRGWLRLGSPPDEYAGEYDFPGGSCGEPAVEEWLKTPYPGTIAIGDCVACASGVKNPVLVEAEKHKGDSHRILLYDPDDDSCTADQAVGGCVQGGFKYERVKAFGCIKVVKAYKNLSLDDGDLGGCPVNNQKALLVTRDCECDYSSQGGTGGTPPQEGFVSAVSLIE